MDNDTLTFWKLQHFDAQYITCFDCNLPQFLIAVALFCALFLI